MPLARHLKFGYFCTERELNSTLDDMTQSLEAGPDR